MKYIITRKKDAQPSLVGYKAWSLFRLQEELRVPEFVVVNTDALTMYRQHGQIVPDLEKELREVLDRMLHYGSLAIRSSGVTEDLPRMSFAGMYATVLNVSSVDDACTAVVQVWDSIDAPAVKSYCEKMQVTAHEMAVIIQHQLHPEKSGVMVTRNPLAPDEVLIECCRGLGDRLVSGQITPTRYHVKDNRVLSCSGEELLQKSEVSRLVQTGQKIERLLQVPQDIEWAIEKGNLYILQSRPVHMPTRAEKKKGTVWCNVNVRETIPDPISPMMYSIFESIMFPMIIIDAFGVPISREQYYKYPAVERVLGRLYWNVNNTMALGRTIDPVMRLLNADKNLDPQMAAAFRHVDVRTLPQLIPSFKSLWFSLSAMLRMAVFIIKSSIFMRGTVNEVNKVLYETLAMAESYEVTSDVNTGITNLQKLIEDIGSKISRRYFGGLFLSLFYFICLGKILSIRIGKRGEAIARKTISGLIDKTGEMVRAVEVLAEYTRQRSGNLDAGGVKRLWREDPEFQRLFSGFIREFGHRGPAEFDVANPNWQEDYDMVFQLIATRSRSALKQVRCDLTREIVNDARPFERFFIKLFMPRISAFTPLRENGKHYYFKATARVKEQILIISEQLITKGYFDDVRDVFFLELKDLDSIAAGGTTPGHVRELVAQRKQERAKYEAIDPPDVVFEDGSSVSFTATQSPTIIGEPVSFGKVKGRARIVKDFKSSSVLKPGEILITHHTDPGWTPLFPICGGVIIETGGLVCHAAMVARELGVPAIVIRNATTLIRNGSYLELDADDGAVRIIK